MAFNFGIIKRTFTTSITMNAIKNVTVIGGGLMGSGIAQVAAQTGHNVTLVDVNIELLQKTESRINASLSRVAKKLYKDKPEDADKFISDAKSRLRVTTKVAESVKDSDLAIEAIAENLEAKQKLFHILDEAAPVKTIFASNTSSLGIREIAAATKRVDRFGGLHFFNPVPVMKLVEVVKTSDLSEETYKALMDWGRALGKVCITCKDTPGFVVNRLLVPYIGEAVRLMERGKYLIIVENPSGDASAKDIDIAMKLGAGYPMGPLELADYVGIDVIYYVLNGWHQKFPDKQSFKPIPYLTKLFKEGKLGVKSGEGFYKYTQ